MSRYSLAVDLNCDIRVVTKHMIRIVPSHVIFSLCLVALSASDVLFSVSIGVPLAWEKSNWHEFGQTYGSFRTARFLIRFMSTRRNLGEIQDLWSRSFVFRL
jgi:hypothetical protein